MGRSLERPSRAAIEAKLDELADYRSPYEPPDVRARNLGAFEALKWVLGRDELDYPRSGRGSSRPPESGCPFCDAEPTAINYHRHLLEAHRAEVCQCPHCGRIHEPRSVDADGGRP